MRFFPQAFGFLNWVGISHFINLLFISLLIRSGLEILSASRDDDIRREERAQEALYDDERRAWDSMPANLLGSL
ncbi:MAG TPA: hypothetical protein VKV03_04535 [Candidatus Binataceae bacterium]|nr:hypothetical protein [Candidatus Binataceae bacterium]